MLQMKPTKGERVFTVIIVTLFLTFISCQRSSTIGYAKENWPSYLGDKGVTHYSLLDQINKDNVHQLQKAWEFDNGEASPDDRSMIQCNPLIIDGTLYGTTATLKVFALDAATGEQKWMFNADKDSVITIGLNRGLAYWKHENEKKIFFSSGQYLFALDPATGKLIRSFGNNGIVDLLKGLGREVDGLRFHMNTPGIIHKDLYIVGGKVSETIGHVPGHIRAYDVRTGEMKWIFHTIPHPGEYGYDTWPKDAYLKSGGANVWAGFSLDSEREIVFAPTGSPSFDFYGGDRIGSNLFGNSIIALDANTGKRIWHYQTVHHDLWDRDISSPPVLATIKKDGKNVDVIVQSTKMGLLFVLNRETGEPIYPINEVEVPQTEIAGEETWPTQPIPTVYPPFSRTSITKEDLAIRSKESNEAANAIWDAYKKGNMYDPPSEQGTINFPGYYGGGEWGGGAIDPSTGVYYINSNNFPWELKLTPNEPSSPGHNLYKMYCIACHGNELEGSSMFGNVPALINVKDSLSRSEIVMRIKKGKGVMPAYERIGEDNINQIADFLTDQEKDTTATDGSWPYPHNYHGHKRFDLDDGYSMIKPPWGQLTAIDLNSAKIKWQIPLGNYDNLNIPGHPITGTPNFGGPVVTKGGLVFIAATADSKIRAFDKDTGKQLWEAKLPTSGSATPATYSINGKQYLVIACGGGRKGTKSGDSYVAFALP
jgi:quinoprotein glucose dehydrogenase